MIEMRLCDRKECSELARWESYTRLTYSAWCDEHKPPREGTVDQRHHPEGILATRAIFVRRETEEA